MSLRDSPRSILLLVGLLALAFGPTHAHADEATPTTPSGELGRTIDLASRSAKPAASPAPPADYVSGKNIGDALGAARQKLSSVFDFGIRDLRLRLDDRIYKATRMRFSGIFTLLYQDASTGKGPREAAGGDLDILVTWDAVQRRGKTTGSLEGAFEGRYRLWTDIAPSALSTTIDSLWPTVSGFNQQPFSLVQFYWRQSLWNDRLTLKIGKLSGSSTFFGNRINSSSLFFVNYAFSDNPAVFFPGNGLGLHAIWKLSPKWTFAFGIQNANGVKTELDPSTLRYGEFWFAAQAQYHAKIRGLGKGTYRLGTWAVMGREPADAPPGQGAVLSIDQELGKRIIGILRYEYQGDGLLTPEIKFQSLTGTESALRVGMALPGPIAALPDDFMGVAVGWGVPADSRARESVVGEIFYRSQIESSSQLTLSLQAIRSSTIYDQVLVFSVRWRVEF